MFSGIVQCVGTVKTVQRQNQKARFEIQTPDEFMDFEMGESIAVNGVCLTVCEFSQNTFQVDLSTETLSRTNMNDIHTGSKVNLERSLTPNQKISGHFVSGHIDQMGTVRAIDHKSGEILFRFEHPPELGAFIIEKGSIAIDGISLTVFACENNQFSVSIIPFTFGHTNLNQRKVGDRVNLECDMIGKYVIKACQTILGPGGNTGGITPEFLKEKGYL